MTDTAITVDAELPLCGNCGHQGHLANSEVCQTCLDESNAGTRAIEDCCAAYVPQGAQPNEQA